MNATTTVIFEKIRSTHDRLDRNVYTGYITDQPHIGEQFTIDTREAGRLWTTPVKVVRYLNDREVEFDTKNSTYKLTYIKEDYVGEEIALEYLEKELVMVFAREGVASMLSMIGTLKSLADKLARIHGA